MIKAAVGALLLASSHGLDMRLKKIWCRSRLPVSVDADSFSVTCGGSTICTYGDTALVSGDLTINGVEDNGLENGIVYMTAYVDTMTSSVALVDDGTGVNLCKVINGAYSYANNGYNNNDDYQGDDNYQDNDDYQGNYNDDDQGRALDEANDDDQVNNGNDDDYYNYNNNGNNNNDDGNNNNNNNDDAYQQYNNNCLQDGTFEFSSYVSLPFADSNWLATGFKATGDIRLYTGAGDLVGSCDLVFRTQPTSDVASARTWFMWMFGASALFLFVGVYVAIRQGTGHKDLCDSDAKEFSLMKDDIASSICGRKRQRKKKDPNRKDTSSLASITRQYEHNID